MSLEQVSFYSKMILDELIELWATKLDHSDDITAAMTKQIFEADFSRLNFTPSNPTERIADQADAMVDIMYYTDNCAAKQGMDMDRYFNVVHTANEAKRDPATGQYVKREDGKIVKPKGWQAPDMVAETQNQLDRVLDA